MTTGDDGIRQRRTMENGRRTMKWAEMHRPTINGKEQQRRAAAGINENESERTADGWAAKGGDWRPLIKASTGAMIKWA
jgi:hypothetical protein